MNLISGGEKGKRTAPIGAIALASLVVLSVVVGPLGAGLGSATAKTPDTVAGASAPPETVDVPTGRDRGVASVGSTVDRPVLGTGTRSIAGHDPGHTGHATNASGPTTDPDARWIHEFADDTSDVPAVAAGGLVFVPGRESLRAVNADTGETVWNVSGVEFDGLSVADGVVVTTDGGYNGDLRAYHAANGTEVWNVTGFEPEAAVVLDGTLYVARPGYSGERLYAFDLATGTERWYADFGAESVSGGLSATGDTVYATGQVDTSVARDYAVYALNASDGSERWRFEVDGPISMPPAVADGSVFVGGGSADHDPRFYRLDADDGHVEWAFDVNARPVGAAVANGSVYVAAGHTLWALDGTTGEREWLHRLSGSLDYGLNYRSTDALTPLVADGVVYAANDRGHLVALDGTTGAERWTYRVRGQATRPVVAGDRLYVHAIDTSGSTTDYSRIYALEEAPFEFSGFVPSKTTVETGEGFTVDVTVENVDDETRRYNLSLVADTPFPGDARVLDRVNGSLAPGATTTVTFTTALHSAAAWNLSVRRHLEDGPAVGPVTVDVDHASSVDAWPMGGFDANRTDANPDTDGPGQHFQEAWNTSSVDQDTTPVVVDGTVYLITHENRYDDREDLHAVTAYDETTGAFRWAYNFTAENRVPAGSPAVVNDTVYVVTTPYHFYDGGGPTEHGSVYAIDAATGTREWKTTVSINASSNEDHGPVVAGGRVHLAGAINEPNGYYENGSVVALDADTGGTLWSYTLAERGLQEAYATYAVGESHVFATVSDAVSVSDRDEELHAFDAASGTQTWTTGPLNLVVDQGETPVVADGLVLVVNESKNAAGEPAEELVALDVATGAEQWRFAPTSIPNSYGGDDDGWTLRKPALRNGSLYVRQTAYSNTDYNRLHRVDAATGSVSWNTSTGFLSRIQVADGVVYGAETTFDPGYTRIYDAETGERLGHTGQGLSLSVANGTSYAFDDWNGRLRALVEGGAIEYADLSVDTHTVGEGENVTVTATATNVGDLAREYAVNLDVAPDSDHHVWNSVVREGLLGPGDTTTVTWTVKVRERGDFVFVLQPSGGEDSLERFMYDRAGSVTVNVGDDRDGRVVPLGGSRSVSPTAGTWPTHALDARNTGNRSEPGPTGVPADPVNWSVNASTEWHSGPTVADGSVFVGGVDPAGDRAVVAHDAADGSLRWSFPTHSADSLEIAPTYAGGYVYAGDDGGRLYQLNASTGERLWTFTADRGIRGVTVVDDTVYVAVDEDSGGALYALNATTRERLWSFASPEEIPVTPAVDAGTVYLPVENGTVYALDAATGAEEWAERLTADTTNVFVTSPVVGDGVVYAGVGDDVYALDAATGTPTWNESATFDGYAGVSPALANGTLYFGGDGKVSALDADGGGYVWNRSVCTAVDPSPAIADGVVYTGTDGGEVLAVDAATGDLAWRYAAGATVPFQSAVADGRLFVAAHNRSSDVHRLSALTGGETAAAPALFDYSSLNVSTTTPAAGQDVTVSATVENLANSPCTYTAEFKVDGVVETTTSNELDDYYTRDSETVEFTWTPTTPGSYNVTIAGLPPVEVTVSAAGPAVDLSPDTRDFGGVAVGDATDRWVQVSNVGTANLTVLDTRIAGTDAADYRILSSPGTEIAPGDSAYVWIRFGPSTDGDRTATLEVETDDPNRAVATAALTGTGTTPAEVDVSPTALDFGDVDVGANASRNVTVSNVGGSPLAFYGAGITGTDAGAFALTAGDTDASIPAGGSHLATVEFEPSVTGTASATLELSTNDTDEPTVTVALSGNGTVTAPNRPPVAVADHYTVVEGEWLNVSGPGRLANDIDPDNDSFSASHHGTPDNGTLHRSAQDGSFQYLPDPGFTGTDSYVYRIRDAGGNYSGFATVTIEVRSDPNRPPEAVDDRYSVHAGEWLNVSGPGRLANDRDPDGDSFSASHHGSPNHGTLHRSAQDGSFQYRADPWYTGTDSYVYRVRDEHGEYSEFATVTIEVLPARNRAPVAVEDHYTVSQGEWLNVSGPGRLANDYDVDNDSFSASHHGSPNHGTLHRSAQDGSFQYKPDPGFTGTDSYVYRIRDSGGEYSSFARVTIEVVPDNRAPTVVTDHYATLRGEWLNVSGPGRLANDYDLDGDSFSASHHGQPDNGTLHRSAQDGSFQYLPDPGFTGTDSYVYRVRDDRGDYSGFGSVSIQVVDPAGTAPVAVPDHYTVTEGEWLNVSGPGRLANDLDPNGDPFSASHHGTPDNGTLHRSAQDGSFQYKPDPGFTGTDSYVYRVRDSDGEYSSFATVTIEVLPDPNATGNRAPTVVGDRYTVFEGEWLNVSGPGRLANDYDLDGDAFSASHHGQPDDGTLHRSAQDGSFQYRPDPGFTGTDSYVYRVRDEHGEYSGFGTVTIEVVPDPNRRPTVVEDRYTVFEGEWLNVSGPGRLANDRDPDGDAFAASHHGRPDNGTLHRSAQDGSLQYRPDPGFTGTDSYVYRVRDEHGAYSWFGATTVEVLPDPNRGPTAVPDHYAVRQGETLTVSGPGRLANDYDPDGDAFSASHHGSPDNGSLVRSAQDGSLEYTPDPGFVGVDSYVYRVRDSDGEYSSFATVTITVVDASASGLADVAVDRDNVDFGTVPAGTNATATVTVANVGDENLTFTGATLSGPNAPAFEVTAGDTSTVLGYGGSRSLTVEYAPASVGTADATLTVLTDDPDEPEVDVSLAATARDDTAPTVDAVGVTGSYVDSSDPNGSVVYENETVDVEVTATDAVGTVEDVRVTLDAQSSNARASRYADENATTGNWTTTIDVGSLADGRYDVVVKVYDGDGNRRTVTANDTVVVDHDPPTVAASVARLNGTAANVTVGASEPLRPGTLSVDVERPDGSVEAVTVTDEGDHWNGTFGLSGDGQYALTATAIDRAGNRGTDDATALMTTANTTNNTITVRVQPSGLFVRFNTNRSVNDTFVTMTESNVSAAPLVTGQEGVTFLDAVIGTRLSKNLSYAVIGIPVDTSLLASGADEEDVTIRYYNETRGQWTDVPTTVENVTVNGTTDRYWVATVTHFSTYGAVAADTTPPSVTATTPGDSAELPAGTTTTTLRVDYEDAFSGVDTDRVAVLFDGRLVTTDTATTVTSGYVEYTATGLANGSSHDLEVSVVDRAGNEHTETVSFAVASPDTGGSPPPSNGGDGNPSSGGGGGQPGGGADGEVTVEGRMLLNGTVATGERVVVLVDLANFDPARGTIRLDVTADGAVVSERTVAVGASTRRTVFLEHRFDGPGSYELSVNGVAVGTVTVTGAPGTPVPTAIGTTPTVGVTPPTASATPSTATPAPTDPGTDTPAGRPSTPSPTSGDGAGFGPVAAFVALLVLVVFGIQRKRD